MESNHNTPALYDVLKQFDLLKVDDYQRTYAWTRDEVGEFFSDLCDTAQNEEFHFFGTLIFQSENSTLGTVVDGQQRLTTVFIFMSALRDSIINLGIDTLPRNEHRPLPIPVINKVYEFLFHNVNPDTPRFKSNRFIEETLIKSVYAEPAKQTPIKDRDSALTLAFRKSVREIRKLVREDLEKIEGAENKLVRINQLIDTVRDRFVVLRVQTHSLSESLEIFLTLNNRGLPLGPSDLVRGEIIAKMSHDESEARQRTLHKKIFEEWSDIADNVQDAEAFLRHYLVASGSEKVQKKKVYDTVAVRLKGTDASARKTLAADLWQALQDASVTYNKIINPQMGGDTQYYLEALHGLMKSHRILLLSVLDSNLDPTQVARVARQLYVLCFRWQMTGGNAQRLEDSLQKFGNSFKETKSLEGLVDDIDALTATLSKDAADLYLREDADDGFIGRAILHAINRARTPGANAIKLDSTLHLEHIAPQTETDEWKRALFSGVESQYDAYDTTISQIGNLTLLDFKLNVSAKQALFAKKKKTAYDSSTIKLTNDLKSIDDWTDIEVEKRSDYLIEMFNRVFSVNQDLTPVVPFEIWLQSQD